MEASITRQDGGSADPLLHVKGEIDLETAAQLQNTIESSLSSNPTLTIDMADVTFIDARGLHAILRGSASRNGAGRVTLVNASAVSRLVDVLGLTELPITIRHEADAR